MFDLSSFSLNALLNVSMESDLISRYRTTEWVVVLDVDGRELIMNHDRARIFLQGLIYGAALKSRTPIDRPALGDAWTRSVSPKRVVVG